MTTITTTTPASDPDAHEAEAAGPDALSPRVNYAEAAAMLCVSHNQLKRLVSSGELPVIQPARGPRGALIEVKALHDLMDRWRVQAQRKATSRAKAKAGRRKGDS